MQNNHLTKTHRLRTTARCFVLCATVALTACANLGNSTPEEQVRERANQRWQALVKGDFSRAYTYSTPAFRAVVDTEAFRGRSSSAVIWLTAEAVEVTCPEPVKCIAKVRLDFKPVLGARTGDKVTTHFDETWLLEDGNWWIFQKI